MPELERASYQASVRGLPVDLYTLRNRHGMRVRICNLGARIQQILAPDRHGQLADVVLGHGSLAGILQDTAWHGAFAGRYANRIGGTRLLLDGVAHKLPANDGPNLLHGGDAGCAMQVFDVRRSDDQVLALSYCFVSANDGFPGDLDLQLTYRLDDANTLAIEWVAQALDRATVASFTSHGYFNLSGVPGSTVLDHQVTIHADRYLETGDGQLPTGRVLGVEGTPFDFRQPRSVGGAPSHAASYDHYWVKPLAGQDGTLTLDASVHHPASGRGMEVWSTEPGLQFYAGHMLNQQPDALPDKHGLQLPAHAGLCLAPSRYPDAPNHPQFPDTRITPGSPRTGCIQYRFTS